VILKELGLLAALRHLAHDMENDTISIRFRSGGPSKDFPVMSTSSSIVSPRNAPPTSSGGILRHRGKAAPDRDRRAVRLTVWDNGIGFDPNCIAGSHGRGAGLRNMKASVEEAGGRLTITSKPGSTKVTATIPRPFLQRFLPMRDKRSSD
jgi:two-component system NarL family sensor kinase